MPFGGFDPDLEEFVTKPPPLPRRAPTAPRSEDWRKLASFAENETFTVTSTTGGRHNRGSRHGGGGAVDVRTRDKTPEEVESFMQRAQAAGLKVRDERVRPPGQQVWKGAHLHLEPGETLAPAIDPDLEEFVAGGQESAATPLSPPASALAVDPDLAEFVEQMSPPALQPAPVVASEDEEVERVTTSIRGDVPLAPAVALPPPTGSPAPDIYTAQGRGERDRLRAEESDPNVRERIGVQLPLEWSKLSSRDVAEMAVGQFASSEGIPEGFTREWLQKHPEVNLYGADGKPQALSDLTATPSFDEATRTLRVSGQMPQLSQLKRDYESSRGTLSRAADWATDETRTPGEKFLEATSPVASAAMTAADYGGRPFSAADAYAQARLKGADSFEAARVAAETATTGQAPELGKNPVEEAVRSSETLANINPNLPGMAGFLAGAVTSPSNLAPGGLLKYGGRLARGTKAGARIAEGLEAAGDARFARGGKVLDVDAASPLAKGARDLPAALPSPVAVRPDLKKAAAEYEAKVFASPPQAAPTNGRKPQGVVPVENAASVTTAAAMPIAAPVRTLPGNGRKAPPVQEVLPPSPVRERSLPQTLEAGGLPGGTDRTYTPITNKESVATAQARVQGGVDSAADFVLKAEKPTAEVTTTGVEVMRRLQREADTLRASNPVEADAKMARAVEVANHLSQKLTEAGQAVQAASIVSRLSPDGILLYAERVAKKSGDVKVTTEQATALRTAATRMAGAEVGVEKAKRIVELSEKARTSGKLTPAERGEIRTFVTELQPFAGDKAKASPRQSVVSILTTRLDTAETSARARLAERAGKKAEEMAIGIEYRQAGIPVPVADIGDFAIIGAAKLARKAIKFDEWASEMMGEFGDSIKDILPRIYRAAEGVLNSEKAQARAIHKDARALSMTLSKIEDVGRVDAPEATRLADLARSLKNLKGDARTEAAQELQGALQALDTPGIGRRISTAQTMGQLLNPKTQTRNIVGNEMFYRLERINKYPATLIDFTRSKLTGSERKVTFRTAGQGEYWKNFYRGAKAGAKGLNPGGITSQYDFRSPAFKSKYNPMFYLERTLKASMQGFDFAAYSRAKNQTLGELGTLKAMNESVPRNARKDYVRKFIDSADAASVEIADQYGKFVTFQDDNLISGALTKVKAGMNLGKDFGVGDIVLKYPKTPGALLMRAIEYSPAGIVKGIAELKPFMKEAANVRGAEEAIARAITGTAGTTALGYFLAANGVLSSEGAEDKDAAAFKSEQTGERRYQVNTSAIKRWMTGGFSTDSLKKQKNDTLMSYDWAQPIAIGLSIGANIQKNLSSGKRADTGLASTVTSSIGGAIDTIVEQPVLQGIRDVLSDKYDEGVMAKAGRILEGVPASFVPTFLNQIKQARDNKARITHDLNPAQRALNRVMVKIPFLADRLPEAYTTLGASKETYRNGTNSLFNVFLNPAFVDKYSIDPEIKMVLEPFEKEGRKEQFPKVAPRKFKSGGKSYELTGRELSEMQKRLGLETLKRFRAVDFEALKRSTPEDQEKELADGVKEAWEQVRDEYLKKRGVER